MAVLIISLHTPVISAMKALKPFPELRLGLPKLAVLSASRSLDLLAQHGFRRDVFDPARPHLKMGIAVQCA